MECIRRERALTVPNLLTILRMALLPVIVWRFRLGDSGGALAVYLVAMMTDAVDGVIARTFHQETALGRLLDPMADKLTLLTLLWLFAAEGQIPAWLLNLVLLKEAVLILGSAFALGKGIVVQALPIGKLTTAAFVASMTLRFAAKQRWADDLLALSVVLSIAALGWYGAALLGRMRKHT